MSTIRLVTRGPWSFGTTSGFGIQGKMLTQCRVLEGKRFKDGRGRIMRGQLYGLCVATHEEADALGLLYGYTQPYNRNAIKFVMSRAARRRGHKSADPGYLRRAAAGKGS